jgi:hypothetical protein
MKHVILNVLSFIAFLALCLMLGYTFAEFLTGE